MVEDEPGKGERVEVSLVTSEPSVLSLMVTAQTVCWRAKHAKTCTVIGCPNGS